MILFAACAVSRYSMRPLQLGCCAKHTGVMPERLKGLPC